MDAEYLAPQGYSVMWPVLGGLLLLALLVWFLGVWLTTRAPEDEPGAPLPPDAVMKMRDEALTDIDRVEREVTSGETPARRGHHELSTIVRGFVARASGLEADTMTAADLRYRGPRHLAALIEEYYPRQFGPVEAEPPSIGHSADAARQVVGGWSAWG